ncbi:hypothetical protein DSO57_1001258 [Entomophthora muscae]|uniref:Uncharacterized protein n=1 Tax=Entomophthora muscae TaxID=34485 RepID=A0ACC2SLU1_9FUNG|nr:hypothetical protein DSO57_1001258 [Entomophthora muscae]
MHNLSKLFIGTVLFFGHCSCYGYMATGLNMAYNRVGGFGKLLKLILTCEELKVKGEIIHVNHSLPPPRPDFGITAEDMRYFLPHSLLALCTANQVASRNCFCEGKFENAKHFRNESLDAQAVIAADPNRKVIVVSIRMTVSDKNWDTNYRADLVPHPLLQSHQKVHQGHLEHFLALRKQLVPAIVTMLRNPEYKDYSLHISGFSLGASVSAISLPFWIRDLNSNKLENKIQLFTYSGPRPGNLEFARHLESLGLPLFRYVKRGDVVPHVPDQFVQYSQVGQEFYDFSGPIMSQPPSKCANNLIEDPKCALKNDKYMATHHLTPFHRPIPIPPFC